MAADFALAIAAIRACQTGLAWPSPRLGEARRQGLTEAAMAADWATAIEACFAAAVAAAAAASSIRLAFGMD